MSETTTRPRSKVTVNMDNSGLMFPIRDSAEFEGAFRIDGVVYDVRTVCRTSARMQDYYSVEGTSRDDPSRKVRGALFAKDVKGNVKRPSWTGSLTLVPSQEKRDMAAWDKLPKNGGNAFLSLTFKPMRDPANQS